MIRIHNLETGEIIDRDFSEQELLEKQKRNDAINQELQKKQDELEATQSAKDQAQAKLLALGLNADDLKALGLQHNL